MKVILLKDVKKLGRAHDTVEVSDGHALNMLIPGKLAVVATGSAAKEAKARASKAASMREVDAQLTAQNLATLAEARIVIKAKANEKEHLYDAVGEPEILAAINEQAHVELPAGTIRLEKPIKELGTFEVPVSVGEAFGKFSVTVEAE